MKSYGRKVAWLVPLLLTVVGLLWPLVASGLRTSGGVPLSDPVVFSTLRADFTVGTDGRLAATETITARFPSGRHGIFRFWDVADINDLHARQVPEVSEISLDGEPVPYQLLWQQQDRFLVAKIGDRDHYLDPGDHVFVIRYAIPGALHPGGTGAGKDFASETGDAAATSPSVFLWNVVAPAWNNVIERAEVTVKLPAAVPGAQCSVGRGVGRACEDLTVHGDTVELVATNLPPQTPVTLRAGVEMPTPPQVTLPWTQRWDPILGRSVPVVGWLLGLTAAAGLAGFLWWRTTVEPEPGFPLQYAPPPGLGPVQCEYIRTERVPNQGLVATFFYLADRGLVTLDQVSEKKWTVRATGGPGGWAGADQVSAAIGSLLGVNTPGGTFEADATVSSGRKLTGAKSLMTAEVKKWAFDGGLVVKRRVELWLRFANVVALALAVCGFIRWFFPITLWGLPFAVFFLLTVPSWSATVGRRRTPAGRQLWSQVGGFHRMLATDSAESRFDFAARENLYTAYIPFAVAGGAAALWAAKYQAATGQPPPAPDWYHSSSSDSHWSSSSFGNAGFDSFESALSSSIGAYTASQSSSSGDGGGGGGGGDGGGGGGSW